MGAATSHTPSTVARSGIAKSLGASNLVSISMCVAAPIDHPPRAVHRAYHELGADNPVSRPQLRWAVEEGPAAWWPSSTP